MARRKFNRELIACGNSLCLSTGKFTVGATGAVGTIYQAASNSIRSVTRNSDGNYTFQFNEPYPLVLAHVEVDVHRAAVADAFVKAEYDAASYSSTDGQFEVACTNAGTTATDPAQNSELQWLIIELRQPNQNL